ncbi:hypothetical protein L228DRAFT_258349 [Xylona heveae TC161]|uniref:Centrosomin N-terminal motif 1 domain-containing protein n=1 Tax=Xylona heveae (strain CBS 132557 / TC161) TaxID=1328760 RepID=A0A165IFW0_XYLHT|nr:hypothetical protein L228DRAFT_258349 [Xylona heveae TC161]KZF24838.1 hypothetical protein L228DRAFT_258349 [Xylona heveae TC161]
MSDWEASPGTPLHRRPRLTRATTPDYYGNSESQPSTPWSLPDLPTPTSALLQNLLRERKQFSRQNSQHSVDSTERRRRSSSADVIPSSGLDRNSYFVDSAQFIQSSPMAPRQDIRNLKPDRRVNPPGQRVVSGPRGMGIRQMDEHISKLHKQVFDLKLEVFHRRERAATLQQQLEEAQSLSAHSSELESAKAKIGRLESQIKELSRANSKLKRFERDNSELQDINEQLLNELEKRDAAVHDAVNLICALEEKISTSQRPVFSRTQSLRDAASILESSKMPARSLETAASPSSTYTPRSRHSSRLRGDLNTPLLEPSSVGSTKTPISVPLSLHVSSDTASLRKLDLDADSAGEVTPSKNVSEFDAFESPDTLNDEALQSPKSPQLSVLSESSFISIYGQARSSEPPSEADEDDENDSSPRQSLDASSPSLPSYEGTDEADRESVRTTVAMDSSDRAAQSLARARKYLDDKATPTRSFRLTHPNIYQYLGDIIYRNSSLVAQGVRAPSAVFQETYSSSPEDGLKKSKIENSLNGGLLFGPEILPPTPDTMSVEGSLGRKRSNSSAMADKSMIGGKTSGLRRPSLDPRPQSSAALRPNGSKRPGSFDRGRAPMQGRRPTSIYSESNVMRSGQDAQIDNEAMRHLSFFNGMPPPPALRPVPTMALPNEQLSSENRPGIPRAKTAQAARGRSPATRNAGKESLETLSRRPQRQRAATTDGSTKRPSLTSRILGRFG